MNYKCSYCGNELGDINTSTDEAFVIHCPNCKKDLAIVSAKKLIPLLPRELYPKEEK